MICLAETTKNGLNSATSIDMNTMNGMQKFDFFFGVAAKNLGMVAINVYPNIVDSSLRREDKDSDVNGVPRVVEF